MIDQFICKGDYILFLVMLMITELFSNIDMSTLHYKRARENIIKKARKIDSIQFYHRLMSCSSERKDYSTVLDKIRKDIEKDK